MAERIRFLLDESDIPRTWTNMVVDLPQGLPPMLHPGTRAPIGPEALCGLFPQALAEQEFSTEADVPIPDEVREMYRLYRPTPLIRAVRLERLLGTPAHIYYKYEGAGPAGSHKINTALAQAFYNRNEGVRALVTETGAGQWGSALAMAGRFFGIDVQVFMVRSSHDAKPYRRYLMEPFGARVFASPSTETEFGRKTLANDPDSPGSLGIAIAEAIEVVAKGGGRAKYALGSVMNHVLLHQSVIGEEAILQMEKAGEYPDVVIGCAGGGSNFAGIVAPFLRYSKGHTLKTRFIAVEPESCPSLTKGEYCYGFGDSAGTTPLMCMHTLGHEFVPPRLHAGGLRYHGMAPIVSALYAQGVIEARAVNQETVFQAAREFMCCEGVVPAPESAHAIRVAIDEAIRCRDQGERKVILFNLSGHGHFDMSAFHHGALTSENT